MVRLMVTADDFGISEGISTGILHAHRDGAVNAVSVMATGSWVVPGARALHACPHLSSGAHLQFVGEDQPLLSHREAPTLISRAGHLPRSWRHLSVAVLTGRVDPEDVRAEARAQLDYLQTELGLRLDHVNTHQHVHLLPPIATVVVEEAARAGIAHMRAPSSATTTPQAVVIRRWRDNLVRKAARHGLVTNDAFVGLDGAGNLDLRTVIKGVDTHRQAGLLEVNCHPGLPSTADRNRYQWDYRWEDELAMLTSSVLQCALTRPGVTPWTPPRRSPQGDQHMRRTVDG